MMTMLKTFTAAALTAGTMIAAAAPAQAVVTTFAQYQAIGNGKNIRWVNNGSNGSNGTGGSLYTTTTATSTTPGSRLVSFSFLQPSIAPFVTNTNALFTLNASVTNTPATTSGGFIVQQGLAGSFSFISTAPLLVGSTVYAAGSNLLSGTFSFGSISGTRNGSSGSLSASSVDPADTIVFTSDFLVFDPSSSLDFALSMTSIASVLQAAPTNSSNPTRALRNFRALSTGSFSADPAPIVSAVPEPAVWGLMIVGFGMVGLQTRRRARNASVVA